MENKKIIITTFCLVVLFFSCKDEELSMQRKDYIGNELKTDGYYYYHWASYGSQIENNTSVQFFYRNGVVLTASSYEGVDLNDVEKKMIPQFDKIRKDKWRWGIFFVYGNNIQYEGWTTSVGGGLPIYQWEAIIENDSTFWKKNQTWHYKQFYPKPDSTNNFIK